jgi:nucleoside-diphosphate-sugar epimerase
MCQGTIDEGYTATTRIQSVIHHWLELAGMTRALVTGVAGFVGSHLAKDLLEDGYEVRGFDNLSTGDRSRLTPFADHDRFEFVEDDLRDEAAVDRAVENVSEIYHQAAVPSVPRSVENPLETTTANCVGSTNLLVAAKEADVDSVVVASSSSVYGSGGELPKREDQPASPESPYALSKYWTEQFAVQCSELYGLQTVALRYFNVFGPGQDPDGEYAAVIPKFANLMLEGERPTIYGDGEQSRDFTYVDNVVQANRRAAASDASGEVLNVGCGDNVTVNALVDHLNEILGTDIDPEYDDPRPGDVRHSHADVSKADEVIGYEPEVPFRVGLERTVASLRE